MAAKGDGEVLTAQGQELAAAYQELKDRYDELVGRNVAGVFRTTWQGGFIECNDSMARMLGYADRAALMALPVDALYFDAEERVKFLDELRSAGRLVNHEAVFRHANGRPVHVLENVQLNEREGKPATIDGTVIDVTAFRQAELEQRALLNNYRLVMERARDGLLIVREDHVVFANRAADNLCGNRPLSGTTFSECLHSEDRSTLADAMIAAKEGRVVEWVEVRVRNEEGEWRDLLLSAAPMVYEGAPAVQITMQDVALHRSLVHERSRARIAEEVNGILRKEIAEHRRTQEALRQSRRFARSLIDSSLDMIMAADQEGRITEYNPAASLRFGYEPEEIMGKATPQLYADPSEFQRVQKELQEHGAFAGEIENVAKDGTRFTSFLAASRLYDENGNVIGAMGVSRDITRSKKDAEALRASEERYRDLFENATDLIQSVDANGLFQYANDAWCHTLGYSKAELTHLTLTDVIHPDELENYTTWRNKLLAGGGSTPIITRFRTKAGKTVHVQGTSSVRFVDGRPMATRSIFRDITEEVIAREQLKEHEAKERALFESSEHMFWTVDRRIALTGFNRGYADMIERLYGVRPELNTDASRTRKRFASTEYHEFWEVKYAEAFTGKPMCFETDLVDKEGRRVCNEIFLSPVFEPDGSVEEVFGIGHEITEQKEAEDMVREQAARLKAIFENSANMMIWTLDRDFRITAMNEHFRESNERGMGVSLNIGDDFIKLMMERVADQRYQPIVARFKAALGGKPQQFEVELKNHAGRSLWVENFLNPISVNGEVVEISCLAYGITDKKEAQQKLLQSLHEKEVLLKEVHHRVKNNLQIISSILNLQGGYVDDDPRMLELLRDSQDRIRSMSFIHESLYQTKNFSQVDLATYIDGLTRNLMMSYSLSGRVELERDLEPVQLGLDQAIPCGLILNELISNSLKHAFPTNQGGRIHISLKLTDGKVGITVADNGVGLPEGFDPERDANLGLQLVSTLIGQLDGRIERISGSGKSGNGAGYFLTFDRTGIEKNA